MPQAVRRASPAAPAGAVRLSGTFHRPGRATAIPMGTLMKNTQRQDPCSANHPPRTGPMAAVMEVKPDHVPMARPRSCCEKLALISARLPGTRSAPPIPWSPRATINWRIPGARPHQAEDSGEDHDTGGEDLAAAV